jgi:hypothetical protein
VLAEHVPDEVRTDEAAAACYEYPQFFTSPESDRR